MVCSRGATPAGWAPSLPVPGTEQAAPPPLSPGLPNQLYSISLPFPPPLSWANADWLGFRLDRWDLSILCDQPVIQHRTSQAFSQAKAISAESVHVDGLLRYWANNNLLFSQSILQILIALSKSRYTGSPVSAYPCLPWLRRKVLCQEDL